MVLILRESFDALCRLIEDLYFRYSKFSKGHNSVKKKVQLWFLFTTSPENALYLYRLS